MDNRLKFLYHQDRFPSVKRERAKGGRRRVENRADGRARPSSEAEEKGKSISSKGQAVKGREKYSTEVLDLTLPRKASRRKMVPVPQTDTGRRGENPQVLGKTLVKELGKITP
jgi:hypothetical protein